MIERLLLPIDLAAEHQPTVTAAADLAGRYKSSVTLLHVIETVKNVPFEELQDFYEKLESKAESVLTDLQETFQRHELLTRRSIVYGNRLEQILDYARKDESDLIVMASHTIEDDRQHPRWGSLSHGVAILAPCSVLLLR